MIRLAGILVFASALTAQAEIAVVRGGEHPDFTRIVVEAGSSENWRFGRVGEGYGLNLGPEISGFDLEQAFARIPKDRVSGLWHDPQTGQLNLALSCACHAVAFEFRPGTVVIDIVNGPPPPTSGFEAALAASPDRIETEIAGTTAKGSAAVTPAEHETPDPGMAGPEELAGASYDWLDMLDTPIKAPQADLPFPVARNAPSMVPVRDALLEQIAQGVAEGVVDLSEHPPEGLHQGGTLADTPGLRVAVGDLPGLVTGTGRETDAALGAEGAVCLSDGQLDISTWSGPGTVAELLGPGRSGMLGEFDAPNSTAILRAARLYLSLGFGAEARQYLDLLRDPNAEEAALLRALGHIVDQEPGGDAVFAEMEGCDTAAALWAALAMTASRNAGSEESEAASAARLNATAVLRSFSALPADLRRYFGPPLVDLFLANGDEETARALRDAVLRAPGEGGPGVVLMEAKYHLATGQDVEAAHLTETLMDASGPASAEAAITRVEAAFASDRKLPDGMAATIAAYRSDARGGALDAPLRRAHVLAAAMSADFETAFSEAEDTPETRPDLWMLAATEAEDDLFLAEAVRGAGREGAVHRTTAIAVAARLESLGFYAEALLWLGEVDKDDQPSRLLAAGASLGMRDAEAAIAQLDGLTSAEAEALRARAILQLGDTVGAVAALDRAGDMAGRDRALTWSAEWDLVAKAGPDPWRAAATVVAAKPAAAAGAGPIAQGTALADDSAAARTAVETLLESLDAEGP